MRTRLRNLYPGLGVQSVQGSILLELLDTVFIVVRTTLGPQPVAQRIEEEVAGILDARDQVFRPVDAAFIVDPALDWFICLLEDTRAVDGLPEAQHALAERGGRRDQLEGRTRRQELLGCPAVERTRQIRCQLVVIIRIHLIDKAIAVISRIGDAGADRSIGRIRHHNGSGTRCQGELRRCNFQIVNLVPDEIVGGKRSV